MVAAISHSNCGTSVLLIIGRLKAQSVGSKQTFTFKSIINFFSSGGFLTMNLK
jgi:hypothetical protein